MDIQFYKFPRVILPVLGFVTGLIGYLADKALESVGVDDWSAWLLVCLMLSFIGYYHAGLINRLYTTSITDSLTGLFNRRYFNRKLDEEVDRAMRSNSRLSLGMVDIDEFKQVNDKLGHTEGDRVLVQLAEIFKHNTRSIDTISRWGGDEFALIFPNTGLNDAKEAAERLRGAVQHQFETLGLTISIGLLEIPVHDKKRIMSLADGALYQAKKVKNTVTTLGEDI